MSERIFVGISAPGIVTSDMVASMNADAIMFAMANPVPEIMPDIARAAGARVEQTTGLQVQLFDERLTTVSAHNYLNATNTRGKKRKETVDAVAATLILEDYLTYRKNTRK